MMQNSRASLKDTGKTDDSLLLSKTLKFLAVLIIFFASTQLGLHFWPLSSLVYGIRIDYLSPTLYFLDLLILLYLGLKFRSFSGLQQSERQIGTLSLVTLLPILLTSLLYSQNPLSTLSWSLHLLLYFSFLVTLFPKFRSFSGLQQSERQIGTSVITIALTLALLFQLVLGLAQFYLGHSVGGLMYYFGERMVAVGAPGIATTLLTGQTMLRAYGTFSHPNIFAGWAVIVLLVMRRLLDRKPGRMPSWDTIGGRSLLIGTISTTIVIFLTNSRSAALALFGFVIPFYLLKNIKSRGLYFIISLLVCWFVSSFSLSLSRTDLSYSERLNLQGVSLKVISHFPVFGTGAQASLSTYPATFTEMNSGTRLLQPDHNSLTLFFSWFGFFGILAFLSLLNPKSYILVKLIPILPLLLLDHYLLTSPQGLFILLLYLSIALNYTHAQKNRQ